METKYKVHWIIDNEYIVEKTETTYGERLSAYSSEPDSVEVTRVFQGSLSDCESYIRLKEGGYM